MAQKPAPKVGHAVQQKEGQEQRPDLRVPERLEAEQDLIAQAAGADDAQHGGRADGALEAIKAVGHQVGKGLREQRV